MRARLALSIGLSLLMVGAVACRGASEDPGPAEAPVEMPEVDPAEGYPEPVDEPEAVSDGVDVMAFEPAVAGGEMIVGISQEPDTLYRLTAGMLATSHVLNALADSPYETLGFDYEPVIIEAFPKIDSPEGNADLAMVSVEAGDMYVDPETSEVVTATETVSDLSQVTARFTFVEGLTWEDGTPVTSADSVLAQRLTCDPDTPSSKYLCERTSHYTAIDDRTVEWQGLPGYADQTYYLNIYTPLASHQLGADGVTRMDEMAAAAITEDENFTRKPYSYGPFKIDSWESGEKIVVSRNEHYWRADEGLPFLDTLTYRIIPDTNALFLAAKAGEVDVAIGLDFGANEQIDEADAAGEIKAHYISGTFWERINFNLDPLDDRPPFLACADLRKAVVMGSDRQSMVNVIMKGKTTVADTPAGPEHWAYPPEGTLMRIDYDMEGAAALLEGMGFVDADGDGVREAQTDITCTITTDIDGNTADRVIPAGTPIEMTISTTEGRPIRQETTLLFQQNMADIGIKMNLEYMPANVFFESAPDGAMDSRRFDMALYSSGFGLNPPVGWYCTEIQSPETNWAGSNANGWCDPGYDRAGKRAENTIDRDAALPDYYEAQRLFTEGVPMMGLFNRVEVSASAPGMVNFRPNSTAVADTWNVESWGFGE